ncbi:MAG: proteasome subunit alpha, partial [Acidimicrobiales bacterium]
LYAQYMGNVFTHEIKPLEVEILVAEVGAGLGTDQLYHILYDGSVMDEDRHSVLGGEAEAIAARLTEGFRDDWDLDAALRTAATALAGPSRPSPQPSEFEVAVLSRTNGRRAFRRLDDDEVGRALAGPG